MPRPSKEETDDRAWRKAMAEAAYARVRAALERGGMAAADQGGLVAQIDDVDGTPRRYFVRLTEVGQ